MSTIEFKTGDVVQLKSGGPWMTVAGTPHYGVACEWFDTDGKVRQGTFKPEQLAKKPDPKLGDHDGVPLIMVSGQAS